MATEVRHRPTIRRGLDGRGERTYRHECTCGDTAETRASLQMARFDQQQHLADLPPVPEAQQCRDSRAHDRRPWEPCQMCADQEALF